MAVQTPKKSSALPWPALMPLGHHAGKPAISLQKMVMLVGSRHNAHLHLLSRHVSKAHALILSHAGRVYIRDLASREQVYINGVPEREAWLTEGDLIKIGSFTFKYKAGPNTAAAPDAPPEQANLEIAGADAPLAIAEKVMLIGRRTTCDISLMEASVSTAHAVIFHVGGKRFIRDLGSRTGTFVNGAKIHQHPLTPGDTITVGETEMRYALASEDVHAITPADVELEPIDEIDELEDLVGTAPLDMAAEIQRDGQVLPAELDLHTDDGLNEVPPASFAKEDDLIELEIAHEPQARPQPINEPIELEPIDVEPVAEAPASVPAAQAGPKPGEGLPIDAELDRLLNVPEPSEPELVEIDLSTDPDVSDLPNAADTHAIGMEFQAPPKPTLSQNVVDGPIEVEPRAAATPIEPPHSAPLDEDLAIPAAPAQAAPGEEFAATWADDVLPPEDVDAKTTTSEVEEISPRGGWQGMSRAEEIEALTAQGAVPEETAPVEEAAAELPVAEAPVEETAVEETPVEEAPVAETPIVEPPAVETPAAEAPIEPELEIVPDKKQKKPRKPKAEKKAKGGRKSKAVEEGEPAAPAEEPLPIAEIPASIDMPAEIAATEAQEFTAEAIDLEPVEVEPAEVEPPAPQAIEPEPADVEVHPPASDLEAPAPLTVEPDLPAMEVAGQLEPLDESASATIEAPQPLEITADQAIPAQEEIAPLAEEQIEEPIAPVEPAVTEPADQHEEAAEVAPLDELTSDFEIEDLPPLETAPAPALEPEPAPEEPAPEAITPESTTPAPTIPESPAPQPTAKIAEPTEELSVLEEDDLGIAAAFLPQDDASSADDDFFSGLEETLPVLELDSAELGPVAAGRDPDELLSGDESLAEIEVIEPTEPTPSSALNLNLEAAGEPTADIEDASLTDSTFGRQVEAFTATSSGDIVEDEVDLDNLPELEAVPDPDEELALILGSDSDESAPDSVDVTAGGIDPAASGVVSDEHLSAQQFEAEGDAVRLETPGLAEADAVLGGQEFVADTEGHDVAEPAEPLDEQSFVAEGEAHAPEPAAQAPAPTPQASDNGERPAAHDAPPAGRPSNGDGGNFVIGTDLSSFIGGMPLVLPDLAPPPTAFGRVQVSFAGAKTPWDQAQRPSFPTGQSLAQEVTDAAQGLRDVESMEEDPEPEAEAGLGEYDEDDDLGEGAPGDEWNVAAAFEEDDDTQPVTQRPGAGEETTTEDATPEAPIEPAAAEPAAAEAEEAQTEAEPVELNVHAAPHTIEELHPQEPQTPFDESLPTDDDSAAGFLALDESEADEADEFAPLDEDALMAELGGPEAPASDASAFEAPVFEETPEIAHAEEAHPEPDHLDQPIPPLDLVAEPPAPEISPAAPAPAIPATPAAKQTKPVEPPPAPAKAAAPAMVIPPPPARSLRNRKTAEPPAAPASLTGDSIFGSMEHGNLENAPFAGGVREVDVFSQGSIGLADARRAPGAAPVEAPEGRRPQRVIVPPRIGVLGAGAAAIENELPGEPLARPAYRVIRKKSAAKTVFLVLLVMLVVMALAITGIIYFVHPPQTSRGDLHFERTGALTKLQRDELRKAEFAKLVSPRILLEARTNVAAQSIPAGFLGDPEQFAKGVKPEWPDERPDVMTVSYTGPADSNDRRRLYALLMAMYEDSHADLDRELQIKSNIAKLEKRIDEVQQLRAERDRLKQVADASADQVQIQKLEAAAHQADTAYDAAVAAVKDAQLEVRRAETQLPPSPGEKSLTASSQKGPAADPELASLQKTLMETASQIATVKSAASEEADAKRKELDQAIERFQATAAEVIKESPQLAQYVQAVQQLQEQTHKLSGELIDVQQQQHKRLSAIKKDIDDRVQARRAELWAADKTLSDLNAQLDLAQRKYNAAIDLNYAVDSKDVKEALGEIKNLQGRIDARKMTLGNDPIVTSVADALQDMINVTKERLEADRTRIEKDIKDQESAFAQSNMVEKLPDTQRAQAAALKAKQEAINDLRRQYATALDKRSTDSNNALRSLEGEVSSLNARIDQRKRALASDNAKNLSAQDEAQRKSTLAQKQAALKQAEDSAALAREAYTKASRALTGAMARTSEQTAAQQKLEAINQDLQSKEAGERQDQLTLETSKDQLKTLVTISKPSETSISVATPRDDRMLYSAGAAVALSVLFGAIAVFSVSGGGETHLPRHPEDGSEEYDPDAEAGPLAIHEIGRHTEAKSPPRVPAEGF